MAELEGPGDFATRFNFESIALIAVSVRGAGPASMRSLTHSIAQKCADTDKIPVTFSPI